MTQFDDKSGGGQEQRGCGAGDYERGGDFITSRSTEGLNLLLFH